MEASAHLSRKRVAGGGIAVLALVLAALVLTSGVLSVSFQILGPAGGTPPQGGFHVQGGDGTVTIVRDVGGPVDASDLEIRVDGAIRGTWQELSDGTTTVAAGDSVTIERAGAGDVGLYWTGGDVPRPLLRTDG